jgi:two-component system heavy metal sensor histidine kinase CusS
VISNLLANAVEYNRAGGNVELACELTQSALQISVIDDGPGITQEQIAHIFEPFYRGDAAHRSEGEHLGLGLFLVQSHIRAMGGSCAVESDPGKRTVFCITLPQAAAMPSPFILTPINS